MDPLLSPSRAMFRSEVAAVLAGIDPLAVDDSEIPLAYRALAARGWLAPHWPVELGGIGATEFETALVHEQLVLHGVPDLDFAVSIAYAGSLLLRAGTDEQRRTYLPGVASGDLRLAICYTEADAGSDLTALRSRAEPDGNGFVLYGRKLYSQTSMQADLALVAARVVGPPPSAPGAGVAGITLFLVHLDVAEVLRRRVPNLTGIDFVEVIMDGVRVDSGHVVGPVGGGWATINDALALERTGFEPYLHIRRWFDACVRRAAVEHRLDEPVLADRLTDLVVRLDAAAAMTWRLVGTQADGGIIDPVAAAAAKWWITELAEPVADLAVDLVGGEAVTGTPSGHPGGHPGGHDALLAAHRQAPGLTLSAGTSEIMLLTIASVGLGLR
jgi:alkylation response protein AidB-like acyl-CoA dehydrogenase